MKTKFQIIMIVAVLLFVLTACQAQPTSTLTAQTQPAVSSTLSLSKMLYGVIALEDTENELTSDQLSSMLFYWKGVKTLNSSDNVASEETSGLTEQIYDILNEAQKAYIRSFDLTTNTIQTLSTNLSIDATVAEESDIAISVGGMSGGPMDGGGGMPSGGSDVMSAVMGMQNGNTSTSGSQTQVAATELSDSVIDAFIQYLQEKVETA